MILQEECIVELTNLADRRGGPGIVILTTNGHVQYMNRRSWELIRLIKESPSSHTFHGLLPAAIMEVCHQIVERHQESDRPTGEQVEIRSIAGGVYPVLIRGLGLPGQELKDDPRVLILMESVARRETATLHAKERFQLTNREHSVVQGLAKGWTNKEIAAELGITEPTVKAHIRNIMDKTKCSTRTGIVAQILHA
jgi:DNA-binding CsgD family transcriptional regulator